MGYVNKTIDDIRGSLDTNKVTSEDLFEEAKEKAHKYQDDYNSFVTILDNYEINTPLIEILKRGKRKNT